MKSNSLKKHIGGLLKITHQLQKLYPHKRFTLDGRLVGDIGEIIAELNFRIRLFDKLEKDYDGVIIGTNRKVQIKSTMREHNIGYPKEHHPQFFLALKILPDGGHEVIYNGKTNLIKRYLENANRKPPKNQNFYLISSKILRRLNDSVHEKDRVPALKRRRKG